MDFRFFFVAGLAVFVGFRCWSVFRWFIVLVFWLCFFVVLFVLWRFFGWVVVVFVDFSFLGNVDDFQLVFLSFLTDHTN